MGRSNKRSNTKSEIQVTPQKRKRHPLTPFTPRVHLLNNAWTVSETSECASFKILPCDDSFVLQAQQFPSCADMGRSNKRINRKNEVQVTPQKRKRHSLTPLTPRVHLIKNAWTVSETNECASIKILPCDDPFVLQAQPFPSCAGEIVEQNSNYSAVETCEILPYDDSIVLQPSPPCAESLGFEELRNIPKRRLLFDLEKDNSDSEPYDINEDSGNEFVPESESENGTSEEDCNNSDFELETDDHTPVENRNSTNEIDVERGKVEQSSNYSAVEEFITTTLSDKPGGNPIQIATSTGKNDKQYFCLFCKSLVKKFARHLERKHKTEDQVKQLLLIPTSHPKSNAMIADLRKKGTFMYNTESCLNQGDLIVARRPQANKKRTVQDYIPCPKCKDFYKQDSLHIHFKLCTKVVSAPRSLRGLSKALKSHTLPDANKRMRESILPGMRDDAVKAVILSDQLILQWGSRLCHSYSNDKYLTNFIRQKLRLLGRFVLKLREINKSITNLSSAFDPKMFDFVVKAVNLVAQYNEDTGGYKSPTVTSDLSTDLKKCAKILISNYIKSDDEKSKETVEKYLLVHEMDYGVTISKTAQENRKRSHWNKPQHLPLTKDIKLLHTYLNMQATSAYNYLSVKGFNYEQWTQLAKSTMLQILLFNRKRVGETERILITDFQGRHQISKDSDIYATLSNVEKLVATRYSRMEIRGKLGRGVPILLSHLQQKYINIILKFRRAAGVLDANPYVFGSVANDKFFSACKSLNHAARLCGAKQPELLTGTRLRKQIATICQVMSLTSNEQAALADFMGHNLDIHKIHYKLPSDAIHLAKISRVLIAMENGDISKFKGKSFDTIDVDCNIEEYQHKIPDNANVASHSLLTKDAGPGIQFITQDLDGDTQSNAGDLPDEIRQQLAETKQASEDIQPEIETKKAFSKKITRRTWTTPEKTIVRKLFSHNLKHGTLPTTQECYDASLQYKSLRTRTSEQIKAWVNNQIKKKMLS